MFEKRYRLGLSCALAFLACAALCPAAAAEKTITIEGKFGHIISNSIIKPGFPEGEGDVELGQEVRVDPLASSDPNWDGATVTVYEQNLSYPSHGTNRTFGLIHTRKGDTAYLELDGKWNNVSRDGRLAEVNFEGSGKLLGGTGSLKGVGGPITVTGKLTPDAGGQYSIEVTPTENQKEGEGP
jgi:hypothetical protein